MENALESNPRLGITPLCTFYFIFLVGIEILEVEKRAVFAAALEKKFSMASPKLQWWTDATD